MSFQCYFTSIFAFIKMLVLPRGTKTINATESPMHFLFEKEMIFLIWNRLPGMLHLYVSSSTMRFWLHLLVHLQFLQLCGTCDITSFQETNAFYASWLYMPNTMCSLCELSNLGVFNSHIDEWKRRHYGFCEAKHTNLSIYCGG